MCTMSENACKKSWNPSGNRSFQAATGTVCISHISRIIDLKPHLNCTHTALSPLLSNIRTHSTTSVYQVLCKLFRNSVRRKVRVARSPLSCISVSSGLRSVYALWLQIEDVVVMLKGKQLGSVDTLSVVNSLRDAYRYCHGMTSNAEGDAGLVSALQQGTTEALTVEWSLPKEEQQGRGRLVEEYLAHFCHRLLSKQSDKVQPSLPSQRSLRAHMCGATGSALPSGSS